MHLHILIVREGYSLEQMRALSADENQKIIEKYDAWVEGLKREKVFVACERLQHGGVLITAGTGGPQQAPISQGAPHLPIAGFYIIKCRNEEHAAALARACPVLQEGGAIEIRRLFAEGSYYSEKIAFAGDNASPQLP